MIKTFLQGNLYEIGRGGTGIIYANDRYPNVVIKESDINIICGSWRREHQTIINIHKNYNQICENVDIIKSLDFIRENTKCYTMLERIYRPDNQLNKLAIQVYFGEDDYYSLVRGRGLYLGLKQIREWLTDNEIIETIKCLGKTIGFLHYRLRFDGIDVEYIFGHKFNESNKVYLIDFDKVSYIEKYDDITIDNLYWSLDSESYFPKPDSLYYEEFKNSYISIAKTYRKESIANKVIERYES